MPKSDTWPGGVAMESLSNLDSAGSCDSVISMNSGYSEDSMEHLSAEERACLMYLEETIEALEVQEDSGLSNDEPDLGLQADKISRMKVNDTSSFKSDESSTIADKTEHHALNQTSEPQSFPSPAVNTTDFDTSMDFLTQDKPPVTESVPDSKTHPSPHELCVTKDEDGNLIIVPSASLSAAESTGASEIDVGFIPPPSDFMDEPALPPQLPKVKDLFPSAGISVNKPGGAIDLEVLRQRASMKSPSVAQEPKSKPPELNLPPVSSPPLMTPPPPPETPEPRSPPVVAPKPKKLPANIILKSHKAAAAGSDGNLGYSAPTNGDRVLLDPQRVRLEALRKLGLLPADADQGPSISPKLSPKTRRSWAAPSSPVSSTTSYTPPSTPSTPSYSRVSSPHPASVPLQAPAAESPSDTSTALADLPADVLPAPAAFSDDVKPPLSNNELSAASEATVNTHDNTPPLTPPALTNHLTPPRVKGVKSNTLERSGLGLSSYMASQGLNEASQGVGGEQSPGRLRNTRARPASLGSGKEFSSSHGEGPQVSRAASKEPDLRRSLPVYTGPHHSGDSQKLPRSQGISVLICPRSENEEDRREALKKLGLLRD